MSENECDYSKIHDILPEENEDIFMYNEYTAENISQGDNLAFSHESGLSHINKESSISKAPFTFYKYICDQIFSSYNDFNYDDADYIKKCHKVTSIFKIPLQFEIFVIYGFLQCTNSFLQLFTFLPLRFLVSKLHFLNIFLSSIKFDTIYINFFLFKTPFKSHLTSSEICDLLKGYLLLSASFLFLFIDSSMIYHLVRGQAIIKLYIFYNMLEIADRLCNSLGQDILEALYWAAKNASKNFGSSKSLLHYSSNQLGLLLYFTLALSYLLLHSFIILLQATTLNVAFNSHNKALLTIMISNNFVELKGNVFKKFEKGNLFQMSCSDVRERFSYIVALSVVLLRNMTEFSWSQEHFLHLFPDMLLVLIAEVFIDWVKHAFITKFNEIPVEVYSEYTTYLAKDVVTSVAEDDSQSPIKGEQQLPHHIGNGGIFTDYNSDLVCKQTGFTPLPHAVVLIKTIIQTSKATNFRFISACRPALNIFSLTNNFLNYVNYTNVLIVFLLYSNVFLVKFWVNILVWGLGIEICKKSAHL